MLVALWSLAAGLSLLWNLNNVNNNTLQLAHGQAVASFEKDVLYRLWVADRGGVYVPADEKTPPNPYLSHIKDRDITTPGGKRLTLVNGAYMTRQVHELGRQIFETKAHITSLKPIREANSPDPWERQALESFERGSKEFFSIEEMKGKHYYRFMRPLITDEQCLKCHAKHGYKVGDIRGGISVSIPMEPMWAAGRGSIVAISVGHFVLWGLGLGTLFGLSRRLRAQMVQREHAENELGESERRLDYLANYDSLTHLPNRALFHDRLVQALLRAKRSKKILALLFIDLDHFKNINDSLGHAKGDLLIQVVAARLAECMREDDTVARLGGDEFAVIMENIEDPAGVGAIARKIIQTVSGPVQLDDRELYVGASVGISLYPTDGTDAGMLVMNADTAMYLAKEKGRGNYQFFTGELNSKLERNLALENGLRRVLERNELVLYFQPKVDIHSRRVTGTEALLRWQHPELGMIPPLDFISLAETNGMIVPIGEWVLRAACLQNKAWQAAGHPGLSVAVNLSARQLRQPGLEATVGAILKETGLAAGSLELEITESMMMENPEQAIAVLNELNGLGVKLSVDDFGTGYSSLSYLKKFPLCCLKIDRSFVRDIISDRNDAAIAAAVISLAQNLKLNVIAEGVETEAQLAHLRQLGCHYAQGFLLGRPMPAAEIIKLLESGGG